MGPVQYVYLAVAVIIALIGLARGYEKELGNSIIFMIEAQVRHILTCMEEAKRRIEQIAAEVEIGKVYEGPITKILDFGALVNLLPGKDGLLHISQIAHERVEKVTDYLSEGQIVKVKVLETDEKGRIKLSMKALLDRPAQNGNQGGDQA